MLIISGSQYDVPNIKTTNWTDDPRLRLKIGVDHSDGHKRPGKRIRRIILHTTCGIPGGDDQRPQLILPGYGPDGQSAENVVHYWTGSDRQAGAHLVVDRDGTVVQVCDLLTEAAYHAGGANDDSIGIEVCQRQTDASLYQGQLDTTAKLVRWLCGRFGVQFQIQWPYRRGAAPLNLQSNVGPVGVFAHYHQTNDRGCGDCGDAMWEALAAAGAEKYDFQGLNEGRVQDVWRRRQMDLRITADGDPGPATVAALTAAGYKQGIFAFGK